MDVDETIVAVSPEQQAAQAKEEGNALYKQGKYAQAIDLYTKAIEFQPKEATYYNNRAAAWLQLTKIDKALEDAVTACGIDPKNTKYLLRACKCYTQLGEVTDARRCIETVKSLDPATNVDSEAGVLASIAKFQENASTASANGQHRLAISMLDRCLELCPGCKAFSIKKAEAYIALKEYGQASSIAVGVLQSDVTVPSAWHIRGLVSYFDGETEKAREHFQQALRLDPDFTPSRLALKKAREVTALKEQGNDAFKAGRNQEAYDLYTQALAVDESNVSLAAKLYFNRALVSHKLGNVSNAIADCTNALEKDESYQKALLKRARLYLESEQYDEAVRDFDAASKADPTSREIKQELRNAQLEQKKAQRIDIYKVLEVSKDADDETIRKAYKKLALKWHPDRCATGSDDEKKEYDRKFKELGQAYAILSDPQKKARYDSGQDLEEEGGFGGAGVNVNDIFAQMFGGGGFGGGGFGGGGFGGGSPFGGGGFRFG